MPAPWYPAARTRRSAASPIDAPERRRHRRRRRLLDQLLVPPLHAALALAQVHDGPVGVREDLDLHVAWPLEVPLEQEPVVAERRRRLAPRRRQRLVELGRLANHAHPAPAAARARLDEERVARCHRPPRAAPRRSRPRRGSPAGSARPPTPRAPSRAPCPPAPASPRRGGPTHASPGGDARVGERGVLAQEPVARVDRLRRRSPRPRPGRPRPAGSSRRPARPRSGPPRRPRGRAATPSRRPSTRPPSGSRGARTCA